MSRTHTGRLRQGARFLHLAWTLAVAAALARASRAQPRTDLARSRWLQSVARRLLAVLRVRVREAGTRADGSLIVCNHVGYLDIVALAAIAPTVFVAKKEVARWPVFGWFARRAGTRFVDRARRADVVRVAAAIADALANGVNVVLFPEGTSSDGRSVLPFRSSLLEPATGEGARVAPAAIVFQAPDGRDAATEISWWGDRELLPHLWNLCSLPAIEARVRWGAAPPPCADRKLLARALHAEVSTLHAALVMPDVADLSASHKSNGGESEAFAGPSVRGQ